MQKVFQITDKDVFPNENVEITEDYTVRQTVKVIVNNAEDKIALVTSDRHGLFLLPGGGAESEDLKKEAERECEEEINWEVEIKDIITTSEEFRSRKYQKYETTCFSAITVSESLTDTRTESEKNNDLKVKWFTKEEALDVMSKQLEKLKRGEVEFYNLGFNIIRDKYFIETYYNIK